MKVKDREFIFKIPSAWDGCAIYNMLVAYEIPFGASFAIGLESIRQVMPPDKLEMFLKLCLKNCFEKVGENKIVVVDEDGEVGITGASSPMLVKISSQYILFFMDYWQKENS